MADLDGPGKYALFFHLNRVGRGVVGTGEYSVQIEIPQDADLAYAAIQAAVGDMSRHLADLIGVPAPEAPAAPGEPAEAPSIATGPNGEFPPDLELIYQAFKARRLAELAAAYVKPIPQEILLGIV